MIWYDWVFRVHVLSFMGKGIGYIDLHLFAATLLSDNTRLWTRDIRLAGLAKSLDIGFKP